MWRELKRLWNDFHPRITYKAKEDKFILGYLQELDNTYEKRLKVCLDPVIFSLEELKKNTWDKDRVEQMQKWLKSMMGRF